MLFLTLRIRLICQKWDLIETESETYKSQMYMGIMQDKQCHPYKLSISDLEQGIPSKRESCNHFALSIMMKRDHQLPYSNTSSASIPD